MKFTIEKAIKTQRRSSGTALLFSYPVRYMGVGGQRHAPAALSTGNRHRTYFTGGWAVSNKGRGALRKILKCAIPVMCVNNWWRY